MTDQRFGARSIEGADKFKQSGLAELPAIGLACLDQRVGVKQQQIVASESEGRLRVLAVNADTQGQIGRRCCRCIGLRRVDLPFGSRARYRSGRG